MTLDWLKINDKIDSVTGTLYSLKPPVFLLFQTSNSSRVISATLSKDLEMIIVCYLDRPDPM